MGNDCGRNVSFGPTDLIGFGDTDEIASRENILKIKQCDLNSDSIDTATEGLNSMSRLKGIVSHVAKAFKEDKLREFNEELSLRWMRTSRT